VEVVAVNRGSLWRINSITSGCGTPARCKLMQKVAVACEKLHTSIENWGARRLFPGKTVPMVRLRGKWLQAAGFPPGQRLTVKIVFPGAIEMPVCGKPAPTEAFRIAARRLDRAIATAEARKAQVPA
jgi:hypothetical protein